MQWILQEFEDTARLAEALTRLDIAYSLHKVVPFEGSLIPEPDIPDPNDVVLFGSYTLWRYAKRNGLHPGVFKLRPFLHESAWHTFMLNGPSANVLSLSDIRKLNDNEDAEYFMRPVDDSKEEAGRVWTVKALKALESKVCALDLDEIPLGALRHDTEIMLTQPQTILKEWRIWVVDDEIVTTSLYKEGTRVIYRAEIDDDALAFAQRLITTNPSYATAYVLDICRTRDGLKMLETNCINAAGFYAADLVKLANAIENLRPE